MKFFETTLHYFSLVFYLIGVLCVVTDRWDAAAASFAQAILFTLWYPKP